MRGNPVAPAGRPAAKKRLALAAAHVVADPFADAQPLADERIDWDATVGIRLHLARLGLGIAEAMDTAQRGNGLVWDDALELVKRSNEALVGEGFPAVFAGCGTDGLAPGEKTDVAGLQSAYLGQIDAVQKTGARVIVMASRHLAATAKGADDYAEVYKAALAGCDKPAILHWLGEAFDPMLAGYWGNADTEKAAENCLAIIADNKDKVDGIKLSLLDKDLEVSFRRRLPEGVRMYTGDDFNYPELIVGDDQGHSDALLGIFGPIAPVASEALEALDQGDDRRCLDMLSSTVGLSRHIFKAPTMHYKTGVAFLAWLNGLQDHFIMIAGAQSMRPLPYFTELFRLADGCGLLSDPDLAVARMSSFLLQYGFSQ